MSTVKKWEKFGLYVTTDMRETSFFSRETEFTYMAFHLPGVHLQRSQFDCDYLPIMVSLFYYYFVLYQKT